MGRIVDTKIDDRATSGVCKCRGIATGHAYMEKHYRIDELSKLWSIGRETVRLIVKDEPGVLRIRQGLKRAHTTYSVPESVAARIHMRLQSSK